MYVDRPYIITMNQAIGCFYMSKYIIVPNDLDNGPTTNIKHGITFISGSHAQTL